MRTYRSTAGRVVLGLLLLTQMAAFQNCGNELRSSDVDSMETASVNLHHDDHSLSSLNHDSATNQPDLNELVLAALASLEARKTRAHTDGAKAIEDLLVHFWQGDASSGHITPTWYGYASADLAAASGASETVVNDVRHAQGNRGGVWDRATMFEVLYFGAKLTGRTDLIERMKSDLRFFKTQYSQSDLAACGASSPANFASDDTGWNALFLLQAYEVTGDSWALEAAKGAVDGGYSHFATNSDGSSPHGLWYSDSHQGSSLYEIALALAAWRIFELTNDGSFYEKALASYEWIQRDLARTDGLYWADYDIVQNRPSAADRPNDIHAAGSVSFLAGNMGMAVFNAILYARTNNSAYKERALATARGLAEKYVLSNGTLINDRDAWTNGAFVVPFVQRVLTLPGAPTRMQDAIFETAGSIAARAQTPDGHYGADWSGGTTWLNAGSLPQQIYTSTNSVQFLLAAIAATQR